MTDDHTPAVQQLFTLPRDAARIVPGAVHLPGWLPREQQVQLVEAARTWGRGPVPFHSPAIRGGKMSVSMLCLGWHWQPYRYSRTAGDNGGARVLPLPVWLADWGRAALAAAVDVCPEVVACPDQAPRYQPDAAIVNYYSPDAKMGMHQDKEEQADAPVVSFSIGDAARFRFGNTSTRTKPYTDVTLESGDAFVFGGPARLAYHGVPKIFDSTAPPECGITSGRLNITLRETGLA